MTLRDPALKRLYSIKLWLDEYEDEALNRRVEQTGREKSVLAREYFAKQLKIELAEHDTTAKQHA